MKESSSVAVLGAGVAGLTAAQELAERGFEVTVYEKRTALGGKARTIPVPGSGTGGRRDLPGEHGFRYLPGFYQHLPDTLKRIPGRDGSGSVWDHLFAQDGMQYSRTGREDLQLMSRPGPLTLDKLRRFVVALFQQVVALPPRELGCFARQFLVYATSSEERRFGQWEYTTWWDFIRAGRMSEEYRKVLVDGLTTHLVAARGDLASARPIGTVGEAYVYSMLGRNTTGENGRVFDAPTTESWIDPWAAHLRRLGVHFRLGWTGQGLEMHDSRITAATITDPGGALRRVTADWFVCALPVEWARELWNDDVLAADPRLARMSALRTEWMNGIQFYLRRPTPIINGPVEYVDSPWALVSLSQGQYWRRDLAQRYGDGTVQDCLSVNIANWKTPGILYGRPASECTPEQIADEVLAQARAALECTGRCYLPAGLVHSWFLDPAIRFSAGRTTNDEPLVVSEAGSWDDRPDATTAIHNLFLAGDYVRDNLSCATMEGANQTARNAVNGLLAAADSTADPCRTFTLYDPPALAWLKRIDAARYRKSRPHLLDACPSRPD